MAKKTYIFENSSIFKSSSFSSSKFTSLNGYSLSSATCTISDFASPQNFISSTILYSIPFRTLCFYRGLRFDLKLSRFNQTLSFITSSSFQNRVFSTCFGASFWLDWIVATRQIFSASRFDTSFKAAKSPFSPFPPPSPERKQLTRMRCAGWNMCTSAPCTTAL